MIFEIIRDQTNMLNERRVTYACKSCGHTVISFEFPFKDLRASKEMHCESCQGDKQQLTTTNGDDNGDYSGEKDTT